jgi:molybdopterin adenylyltransferase
MTHDKPHISRLVVATVAPGRGSVKDDVTTLVIDELRTADLNVVRGITVNREREFIQQLVSNIAGGNEADALILVGGVGLGPRDFTCEAIDEIVDRRIEGFGEAYRRLLRDELDAGVGALLERATAGVYNKCVVFALPRLPTARLAVRSLIIPILSDAVRVGSYGARHQ